MAKHLAQYEVLRELGSGAFGSVSLGVGSTPGRGLTAGRNRFVALKQLKADADSEAAAQLEQEFALLDGVKHRCIVRVFEYLKNENTVVMEYIHGVDLRTVLDACAQAREPIFTEAAVEICCEVADALYQAWTTPGDNGEGLELVHRDLKPANILLTSNGDVKILDFGLACVHNEEWAGDDVERIRGTPIYMSPEQARGETVDHRSDLFSLGLIAYELFTGQPAYRVPQDSKDPLGDVFEAIEEGALQSQVRELEAKLPSVGPVLAKLLQPGVRNRYQSGQQLLVDLRRQLYRDRGAYLEEFCEFFFESIHEIEPAPDLADYADRASESRSSGRKSISERLRTSISEEPRGAAVEESEDGFVIASGEEPKAKVRHVGSRAPDETGMLKMFTIDEVPEPEEATGFMPMPVKRKRVEEAVPAPKPTPPSTSSEPPSAPPAPPPAPAVRPTPAVQPPSGAGISGPVATGGIQGPTPGGIRGPTSGAPSPSAAPRMAPPPPAQSSARVKSNRMYALILGLVALVGLAVVLAIQMSPKEDPAPSSYIPPETAVSAPAAVPAVAAPTPVEVDEEPYFVPPDPPAARPAAPSTPSTPRARSGTLRMKLDGFDGRRVTVTCDSGKKAAGMLNGGSVSFSGIPVDSCQLKVFGLAGGTTSVRGGAKTITCSAGGSGLSCN
ncbi:MAG: serine/threonine-protein kinase [Myxococcota bacterium]|nr:serine/threonine-protein kinase [Myxococcota bacterium]